MSQLYGTNNQPVIDFGNQSPFPSPSPVQPVGKSNLYQFPGGGNQFPANASATNGGSTSAISGNGQMSLVQPALSSVQTVGTQPLTKKPKTVLVDISFCPPLPGKYYWQPTGSGASLMQDLRSEGKGRPYFGHFPLAALEVIYLGKDAGSMGLSANKLAKTETAVRELRQKLTDIGAQTP